MRDTREIIWTLVTLSPSWSVHSSKFDGLEVGGGVKQDLPVQFLGGLTPLPQPCVLRLHTIHSFYTCGGACENKTSRLPACLNELCFVVDCLVVSMLRGVSTRTVPKASNEYAFMREAEVNCVYSTSMENLY